MGQLRRNRSHLLNRTVTSEDVTTVEQGSTNLQSRSPVMTRSRAGIQLNPQKGLLTKKGRCSVTDCNAYTLLYTVYVLRILYITCYCTHALFVFELLLWPCCVIATDPS